LNQRPFGPQPNALPDCATPRSRFRVSGSDSTRATGIEPVLRAWNHQPEIPPHDLHHRSSCAKLAGRTAGRYRKPIRPRGRGRRGCRHEGGGEGLDFGAVGLIGVTWPSDILNPAMAAVPKRDTGGGLSQENVQVVRRGFAALAEQGAEGVIQYFTEDLVIYRSAALPAVGGELRRVQARTSGAARRRRQGGGAP
jgi:hypothetical protein